MGGSDNSFFKWQSLCFPLLIIRSEDILSSHNTSSHEVNDMPQVAVASFRYFTIESEKVSSKERKRLEDVSPLAVKKPRNMIPRHAPSI